MPPIGARKSQLRSLTVLVTSELGFAALNPTYRLQIDSGAETRCENTMSPIKGLAP
jgi:hypothetical protein